MRSSIGWSKSRTVALRPIVDDPELSAVRKVRRHVLGDRAMEVRARKDLVLAVLEVWLSDGNAIVREQFRRGLTDTLAPLLARVIEQGLEEGVFYVDLARGHGTRPRLAAPGVAGRGRHGLLARQAGLISFDDVVRHFAAYTDAFERILGAPAGIADDRQPGHPPRLVRLTSRPTPKEHR